MRLGAGARRRTRPFDSARLFADLDGFAAERDASRMLDLARSAIEDSRVNLYKKGATFSKEYFRALAMRTFTSPGSAASARSYDCSASSYRPIR